MKDQFERTYKKSEETNDLLKKIETMLAKSRRELTENIKRIDELRTNEMK